MGVSRVVALCVLSLLITACGGGGGGSGDVSGGGNGGGSGTSPPPSPAPSPPPPPPEPQLQVSLTTDDVDLDLSERDEFPVELTASWTATDLPAGASVYLEITDSSSRFQMPPPQLAPLGTAFTFNVKTAQTIPHGSHAGTIVVRACKDAACAQTYSGTGDSLGYALRVSAVTDWETHQRDSAHAGYVPIWLDASKFARAWEWTRSLGDEPIGGINAVVARKGIVYVTKDVYFGEGALVALNEQSGTDAWRVSFGSVPALGPPALKGDKIFVATTGHEDTFLWSFNASTGALLKKSPFEGQWPHTLSPTVFGDRVYVGAGYYGGTTYSFSAVDGVRAWAYVSGGGWDMFTPAVDENYVYHYDGGVLHLIDKVTGLAARTIMDPFGAPASHSYHGAPMLGSRNNVVAFARGAFSGRASSNVEQYDQRVLSSFDVRAGNMAYEWSTSYAYLTVPATAHGLIYAARNSPMSLDATDETTGQIVWSWTPSGQGDSSFHRNIVVTRNLLFVSSDTAVYALDLETRTVKWRHPEPGMLAISPDRTLYIATGATQSNGKLVAIKLQ